MEKTIGEVKIEWVLN